MIRNGKFCKYHGNEFKVNRDSDGNTIILTKNDNVEIIEEKEKIEL